MFCVNLYELRISFILGVSSLLETLQESSASFSANDEELVFLSTLLQSKELNALVHVHNSIVNEQSHPVLSNAMQISLEVLDVLLSRLALNDDCKELFVLLQRPNLQVCLNSYLILVFPPFHQNAIIGTYLYTIQVYMEEVKTTRPLKHENFGQLIFPFIPMNKWKINFGPLMRPFKNWKE